jgi:hypothetical protein
MAAERGRGRQINGGTMKKNQARWSPEARERHRRLREERKAKSLVEMIPDAGAKLGLGTNASYERAKRDNWPVITLGKTKVVPKGFVEKLIKDALEGH